MPTPGRFESDLTILSEVTVMGTGKVVRETRETKIDLMWALQGTGTADIQTGIGFFDHMLVSFAKHGNFDLTVHCQGDLLVDGHHTVEDVGICLGKAFSQAIGDGTGITRFGNSFIPMDEALVQAVVDVSGRPYLAYGLDLPSGLVGSFDLSLTEEFFRAFTMQASLTLHLRQLAGKNAHHIVEAAFKATAYSLRGAISPSGLSGAVSTKGVLDLGKEE